MTFSEADIAALISEDMPGYALASIGGVDVVCLFRGPYEEAFGIVGVNKPSILCASSSVSSVVEGASITVNSVTYLASTAPMVDLTTGFSRIVLEE